jgi:hypothetical protein
VGVVMYFDNTCIPYDYEPPKEKTKTRRHPPITPELHEKIKRLYQNKTECSGEVRDFAKKHRLPRWKISRYAITNGWIAKQKKEPDWSEKELELLERSAHQDPEVIRRNLKKAGFTRSVTGISLKRRRMRFLQNLPGQSAQMLAMCLGEDVHFILKQIRLGRLKAQRRIQKRTPQQGGNAYLIRDKDAREFIVSYPELIDLRKVDKFWFIDLLAGA